jgi:hypothetical protein
MSIERKNGKKFKKRKLLHCDVFGNFSVTTTVFGEKTQRTIKGEPKVVVTGNTVHIGCMVITRQAMKKLAEMSAAGKFCFHQIGNYEA